MRLADHYVCHRLVVTSDCESPPPRRTSVQSITWPSDLERPATTTPCRGRPLPDTVHACRPGAPVRPDDTGVRLGHIAAWGIAGSIGWATIITGGWLAVGLLDRLIP